ncbi:MAG: ATP-binding protein [Actinomycetota bacterium]|nr:ATP-binding protein [Actinomycetota bacterium]
MASALGPTSAEALDLLPTGVVLADQEGMIVRRNAAADALVDSWEDGVLGRRIVERLLEAVGPGAEAVREQIRTPGPRPRVFEVAVRPVFAEMTSDLRLPTAVHRGAVALFDDVTERVRVEAVRRDFVANVSHELKTPLGAISLLAEALEGEADPVVAARLTGRIGTEARRVSDLVEDLLDLRSIEEVDASGPTTVDLVAVVVEVVDRVEPMADRRGVSMVVEYHDTAPVTGVRTQLLSLVRNLVENGVKYSDDGDTVRLTVTGRGEEVELRISDEGIGIPEGDHSRVFERFYRVDRARARDTGGSGLGLSIVRNVVQRHGGSVELHSREGEGTTVTVRLPSEATT